MSFGFGFGFPSQAPTSGGATLDFNFVGATTLDPQITFTRALNTATYFDSTGTLQIANANVARFDYDPSTLAPRGLLIEEARTNSIRNNTMVGAVAGTPGTPPTNWAVQISSNGITRTVVGVGTEKGVNYVDLKYSGTTSSAIVSAVLANAEQLTQVSAANGQSWAGSWYLKLAAGSLAGLTALGLQVTERDAAGVLLAFSSSSLLSNITSADLSTQRYALVRTLNNASTSFVTCEVRFSIPINTTVDFTLRIGLPQLELGAFATSVIPTSTVAVSRANDDANINTLTPWYNQSEGTLFVEGIGVNNVGGVTRRYAQFNDAAVTDRMIVGYSTTAASRFLVQDNAATVADISVTATTGGGLVKIAAAYAINDYQQATNSTLGTADVSGTLPTVTKLTLGSETSTTNTYLNGYIRRITYYPRRLANTELQAITA